MSKIGRTHSRLNPLQDSKAVQALEEKTHVATLIAFSRYEIGRLHEIRGALQKKKQRPKGFVPERANIAGWNQRLDVQERVRVHRLEDMNFQKELDET
jgi:hypothetical protein